MPRVYLDHASAWPPRPDAVAAIPDDEGTRDQEPPMVQYLKWILTDEQVAALRRGRTNIRIGVDHPNYAVWVDADQEFVARISAMIG